MSTVKNTNTDYIINADNGNANITLNGSVYVTDPFMTIGANDDGSSSNVGIVAQTAVDTYAGLRYNATEFAWQTSPSVNFDGAPITAYSNISGGGGSGNANPGGSNTQIQFNNNGTFGGSPNLIWTGSNLSVTGNLVGTYIFGNGSQLTGLPSLNYSNANVAAYMPTYGGNILASDIYANSVYGVTDTDLLITGGFSSGTFPNAPNVNIIATTAPNTQSGGNVNIQAGDSGQGIGGDINIMAGAGSNASSGSIYIGTDANTNAVYIGGNANVYISDSSLKISGGNTGQFLQTDGTGNLTWADASGGNATPGGSNTQIQFNDAGIFGASPNLAWDGNTISINGTSIGTEIYGPVDNDFYIWAGNSTGTYHVAPSLVLNGSNGIGDQVGGEVDLYAGISDTGAGGAITIVAGDGASGANGNAGGTVSIVSGTGYGNYWAGGFSMSAGSAYNNASAALFSIFGSHAWYGVGGTIQLSAGDSGFGGPSHVNATSSGGNITINGGNTFNGGPGGNVNIWGGIAKSTSNSGIGGSIYISGGPGNAGGANGSVYIGTDANTNAVYIGGSNSTVIIQNGLSKTLTLSTPITASTVANITLSDVVSAVNYDWVLKSTDNANVSIGKGFVAANSTSATTTYYGNSSVGSGLGTVTVTGNSSALTFNASAGIVNGTFILTVTEYLS